MYTYISRMYIGVYPRSDRIQVWDMRLRNSAGRPVLRYSCIVSCDRSLGSPSDLTDKLRQFSTPSLVFYLTLCISKMFIDIGISKMYIEVYILE